jgi:tetratricopeptide (TPR) repeat protein
MGKKLAPLRRLASTFLLAVLAFAPFAGTAAADDASDSLDRLFAELRIAPDAETAHAIDQRIWQVWMTPSDPALAKRMDEVFATREVMNFDVTLELLNQLVVDFPTYAEGWNQRATLYYMLGNYEASLADIDKVLEFEPRHFGALSGRALIHLAQDKRALAIKDMAAALAVHPFLNEKQLFPELQRDITRI